MGLTREKLGRKRKIRLPSSLRIPAEEKARRNRPEAVSAPMPAETPGQLSMDDMMTEETPEE